MRKKMYSYILVFCLISISFSGCAGEVKQTNESLHVYIGNTMYSAAMKYAASAFKREYPDIPVEITEGSGEDFVNMPEEEQKLSAELMSGKGPDVFFIQRTWDIDKLIEAGALADLNEIYDNCSVFQEEDFVNSVMDAGVFEGKRYFIPWDFELPLLLTTQEALDKTGFDVGKCKDFSGFMEESLRYMESEQYDRRVFRLDLTAKNAVLWAGYSLVKGRDVVWDIEETREYYNWCKEIVSRGSGEVFFGDLRDAQTVRDEECLFSDVSGNFNGPAADIRALDSVGTPVLVPFYNMQGKLTARINDSVGVRANSENLDNVQKFLEILYREDTMKAPRARAEKFSVRRAQKGDLSFWEGQFGQSLDGFPEILPPPVQEMFEQYHSFVDEIDGTYMYTYWSSDFKNEMKRFCSGELSYEEAAENAKEKVKFYLEE